MKRCLACQARFSGDAWVCPECGSAPRQLNGFRAFSPGMAEANAGFEAGYFSQLAPLEAGHFWFESRTRLVIWALSRYFPHARSFLEIGCGTGFVLSAIRRAFPDWRLSGSEILNKGLSFAASRLEGVELLQMDACDIPFDSEFDAIGVFDVLEHIERDDQALFQIARAVVPGGGVVLTVPQHPWLWSSVDEYSFHKRRYRRSNLVCKLHHAGFRIVRMTSFVSLLLPVMLLSRRRTGTAEQLDPCAEFRIQPALNRMLQSLLSFERALIVAGASFPAGGSLMVVARRNDR